MPVAPISAPKAATWRRAPQKIKPKRLTPLGADSQDTSRIFYRDLASQPILSSLRHSQNKSSGPGSLTEVPSSNRLFTPAAQRKCDGIERCSHSILISFCLKKMPRRQWSLRASIAPGGETITYAKGRNDFSCARTDWMGDALQWSLPNQLSACSLVSKFVRILLTHS